MNPQISRSKLAPLAMKFFVHQSQLPPCFRTTIVTYCMSREAYYERLLRPVFQLDTTKFSTRWYTRENSRNKKIAVEIMEWVPPLSIIVKRIGYASSLPLSSKSKAMLVSPLILSAGCSALSASSCKPAVACERVKCEATTITWHPVSSYLECEIDWSSLFTPFSNCVCRRPIIIDPTSFLYRL